MTRSFVTLIALAAAALPDGAHAQDSIRAEGEVAIRTTRSLGATDERAGFSGFDSRTLLGEHVLTPTSPGQSRLVFVLHRWTNDSADSSSLSTLGRRSFIDDYILGELGGGEQRGLFGLAVVDRVVSRATDSSRRVEFEHAIEMEGPDALVKEALGWLQRFVAMNRGTITLKLTVASRTFDEDDPESFSPDGAPQIALLDASGRDRLAESLLGRVRTNVVSSPTITVYGGQRGTIELANQTSYVADFEIQIARGAMVADPVIDVFTEGVFWDVTAILDPDDGSILLGSTATITSLRKPMREIETELVANLKPVTIQLPEWDQAKWSSSSIALSPAERGVHVSGLRLTKWDDDGDPRLEGIDLLISVEGVTQADDPPREKDLGVVIGVDGSTGKVFLRRLDSGREAFEISARRIVIERDGDAIGECAVIEALDGVLVLRLEKGEARAGDVAR